MDPKDLINLAKSGDRNAMASLLMENRRLVAAVVCRFVGNVDERTDVIQNIFVKAINHISQFAGRCKFSTWLYRLSFNECIDHGRTRARGREKTEPFIENRIDNIPLNAPDGLEFASSSELRQAVASALKTLPIDQKTAFSLFYFGGYTGEEGAEALSITKTNFFMKLKAARDSVKRQLIVRGWTV